jgi:hypothetical protein
MSYTQPRKKHRWVGPVVVLGTLVILIVAAFFVADKLARDAAGDVVRGPIRSALGSSSRVDVDLGPGIFLFQAAKGRLDHVTISTEGVPIGAGTGALVLDAHGLPLDLGGTVTKIHAELSLDGTAMQSVVPLEGSTVTFEGEQFVVAAQIPVGGAPRAVVLHITPSVVDANVAMAVTALTVDGTDVSIEDAKAGAYGPEVAALVSPAPLCVSGFLPASLVLSSAAVTGDHLVLGLDGTKMSLGSLGTKGSCTPAP